MNTYHYIVSSDYFTVDLMDTDAIYRDNLWTEQSFEIMLATSLGIISIRTARNLDASIEIEISESEPTEDFTRWDQINDCGIEVTSGALILVDPTDNPEKAPHISIKPGRYRARVFYGGLNTLSKDKLEGNDFYKVVLWPGELQGISVLKKYHTPQIQQKR